MASREVKYIAVARRADKVIVAQRIQRTDSAYDYAKNVVKVLNSPGWASVKKDRLNLSDGPNMFYVLIDENRAYIAITSADYPSRFIYSSSDGAKKGLLGGGAARGGGAGAQPS